MFKDLKVFEFTNFSFKTKYNNTVVYSVNSNYLFSTGNQEKKLMEQLTILKGFLIHGRSLISPEN